MSPMDHRLMRPRQRQPAATVPGQPTALIGDSGAGLLWAAPVSDGGLPITGYRVYADDVDVTEQGTVLLSAGDDFGWCSLGGACVPPAWENNTQIGEFVWQVAAVNAVGEGPRSAGITYEMA